MARMGKLVRLLSFFLRERNQNENERLSEGHFWVEQLL